MWKIIEVFLGGGCGCLSRALISGYVSDRFGKLFPYGILTVNVLGSFLIGIAAAFALKYLKVPVDKHFSALIITGFMGGFTTFSSFSFDTFNLISDGRMLAAGTNIVVNVVFCIVATSIGFFIIGR